MSVWFGLHLPAYTHPDTPPERLFDRVVEQAKAAEAAGFDVVSVMDHLYQIDGIGGPDEPMLEGWSVLAALARETTRVRLGTLVTGVTYRNPALLAKQVTTLDTISGGRAILGLGAAWNEVEHEGYGYDFPPIRERMDRLEEALAIIKAMFTEERPSFAGTYYRIERAFNVPRPVQPGGPKILIGGGGEQRTLRIAAKYADMTHWFSLGLDALKHKTEVLERYCEEIGRDPSTIERTAGAPVIVTETEAAGKAIPRADPGRTAALRQGRDARPGGRGAPSVHRGGLHGLHVQQQPVPDARADRARRRGPAAGRERGAGRGTLGAQRAPGSQSGRRLMEGTSSQRRRLPPRWFIRVAWAVHRAITRLTGGRRGLWLVRPGRWGTMRLTTVGRRTGKTRSAIVAYYEDGPNLVTMAMNGWGAPEPAWWLNLQAQPNAEVELKTGTRAVRARAAVGEERERLWARFREFGDDPDDYADRRPGQTDVVVLEPRPSGAPG